MKTLYGLSWRAFHRCTLHGPDARPAPDPRARAGTSRCRCSRANRPRFASPPSCLRRCWSRWSTGSRGAGAARAGRCRGRRADAGAAALLLSRANRLLRCADHDDGLRGGFAYWKSLRIPRWGIAAGVALRHRAGGEAQRLADAVLPGRPLPVDAPGGSAGAPRRVAAGCRWRFVSMLVLGPPSSTCTGPGCGPRRWPRTRAYVNRHLSTSTTTSSTSASTGTTRPRPPRASCCAPPPRSSRPDSPCR